MSNRLQVGIDFSQKRADFGLFFPDGQPLEPHQAFDNSLFGYPLAKHLLLDALDTYAFDGLDVSGEATGYYWLPFFLQLAADPDLAPHDLNLFLLNPRWVHWFKKCFAQDDKTDAKDPFYIAERTRTRRPAATWSPHLDTLPLRFYTRLRFHLIEDLAREKCYLSAFLFLKASAYRRLKPFADVFGVTSRLVLGEWPTLDELAALPVADLALHQVAQESFRLPTALVLPVQRVLDLTLAHITFLEGQVNTVDAWITAEAQPQRDVSILSTTPGIGPVFSSGLVAEIADLERFLQGRKWDKPRKRFRPKNLRDAEDAVAKTAGLWWPRTDSGDFEAEDRRMAKTGNRYLRYYFIQAANRMRLCIPEYADFYARKYREASKHKHKRALVLTARKSVGLVVGLLHRHEAYRPRKAN
jgi:hypothetical protein